MKSLKEYKSVIDYIREIDKQNDQSAVALEYYGNQITRGQYWNYVAKYRNYFNSIGIKKNDAVAICMMNSPEYEFIFAALLENGSIASTVSKSFLNADIKRQTIERNINNLIINVEFLPELIENKTFEQFEGFKFLNRIIFTTIGHFMPLEKEKEYNSKDYKSLIRRLNLPKNVEIVYPGEMKKQADNMNTVIDKIDLMDSIATYSNTGGTTGAPKCAVHTHRAITSLLKSHDKTIFKEYNIKDNSRSLLVIPISHITSQFYALLLRRASGANIIYNPNAFEPNVLKDILIQEKIDDVVLPFGLYYAITRQPIEPGKLLLNTPACGGEPTPYIPTVDVNNKLHACGSDSIVIGTGSTEFGSGIMASYGIKNRSNESGYFFPFASGFLVDPYTDKLITEPGQRGILYANAPWQMSGYLNNEKATNEFFHYKDNNGKIYGTNNDIAEIVGYHNDKPVYSMLGRASDFVLHTYDKKYYPGVNYNKGKIVNTNFATGDFLFDMRDILLNIEGVMEAQPIIVPYSNNSEGYPVLNITVQPGYDKKSILKEAYNVFNNEHKFIPVGIVFRNYFARSLSSDKREVLSLKDEREGYYYFDGNNIYSVKIPKNKKPILEKIEEFDDIKSYDPPAPKLVYSNRKKKTNI